jgi:hypothetical protein
MTVSEFLIALTLGAAALALWINFRFPGIAVLHVAAALVVGQALVPLLRSAMPTMSPIAQALVMTFLIGLPALVYSLLSSIWIIRLTQAAFRR